MSEKDRVMNEIITLWLTFMVIKVRVFYITQ